MHRVALRAATDVSGVPLLGSMGWFEGAQVVEITVVLERCGHRFLWVLRGPLAAKMGAGASDGSKHLTDAKQHLNAFELVADMGVAVPLKVDQKRDNFVEAVELERTVRSLLGDGEEGRKAREKAEGMRAMCREAVEEGDSSDAALRRLSEAMEFWSMLPG